jgi:CRISPR-associated protein Csd1
LAVTCAIIKKYNNNREVDLMALNIQNTDRSYLFGRLLAIADTLEESTYDVGEKRTTNATRYWSAFAAHPAKTWSIITDKLVPYMEKCKFVNYYKKQLSEVHSLFKDGDFSDEKLSPQYILGYWCQRNAKYEKNDNKEEEN